MTSAGYNAAKTMLKCAADHAEEFPQASKLVPKCFYLDDMLVSVDTLEEAREAVGQIRESLSAGGFKLAKWSANTPEAFENLNRSPVNMEESRPITGESQDH